MEGGKAGIWEDSSATDGGWGSENPDQAGTCQLQDEVWAKRVLSKQDSMGFHDVIVW